MSAPNFRTQRSFPLFAYDDSGAEWWEAQDFYNDAEEALDELNSGLTFFKVKLMGGYYLGSQFFVEVTDDADNAGFTEDGAEYVDNESTRYWLDMCKSEAIRKYNVERNKVVKGMRRIADAYGFEELVCTARFSNGEAMYARANNPRARMKAAVNGMI